MKEGEKMSKSRKNRLKFIISIIVLLLFISFGCYVAHDFFFNNIEEMESSVSLPNEYIDEPINEEVIDDDRTAEVQHVEAKVISIYDKNSTSKDRILVQNILPGNSLKKYYQVRVEHIDSLNLYFDIEIKSSTNNLEDILNVKVTRLDTNTILYNGNLKRFTEGKVVQKLEKNSNNLTIAYYEIEISLPANELEEYQDEILSADLNWSAPEEELLIPSTEVNNDIVAWIIVLVLSGFVIMFICGTTNNSKE